MSAPLSIDYVKSLSGPQWLIDRRLAAAKMLDGVAWPTKKAEEWRYSPIDKFDLSVFAPVGSADSAVAPALITQAEVNVHLHNGALVSVDGAVDGLTVVRAVDSDTDVLGALPADPFGLVNAALAADPIVLKIGAGATVSSPILVSLTGSGEAQLSTPLLVVEAGADAQATVVVSSESQATDSVVIPRVYASLANSARIRIADLQILGPTVTCFGHTDVSVDAQATFSGWGAGIGGSWARQRVDVQLNGRGSNVEYAAAYFGTEEQILDYRMFIDHVGADTTSNLLFNGVVDDKSMGIYTGMIRIAETGCGSNANQTNRTITLSDDAAVESVPNLEILNNDVHCSHASTVGPVDADQLFYLETRGVPTDQATKLVVGGFFDAVLDAAPAPGLADRAQLGIDRKLGVA